VFGKLTIICLNCNANNNNTDDSNIDVCHYRRVYRGLSASSEAYYRLRREFAVSHAQLCISHYILGIGDRHLSNFMVDLQTGAMVGIDFGHAFGSATQVFRLFSPLCGINT